MMALVIIESPYAGDIKANVAYARACMRDSLERGEYPIASHLLYTQPGILRDEVPSEREWGISAGLAWRKVAEKAVFYIDRGLSSGMIAARDIYRREGFPFEVRSLPHLSGDSNAWPIRNSEGAELSDVREPRESAWPRY